MAEISESDYQEWLDVYHRASTAIQNRVLKLEESYELIEKVCVACCSFLGFGLVGREDEGGRRDEQKSGFLMIVLIFYTMRSESLLRNSA